ncbi:MAG: tetratricopeptide (TPR) repeat protein, partial [Cognaticolwellia sp.]
MIFKRIVLLPLLVLLTNLFTSSVVQSQNQSLYIGKKFGQQLSVIEAMVDKKKALVLITSISADKTLSTLDKLSVLASQSRMLHQLGQLDHAIDVAQKEQLLAKEFDLKQLEADAYKRVGVYAYYKGKYALALHSYQQALNYYSTLDEPIAQANLYNNIALVHAKT